MSDMIKGKKGAIIAAIIILIILIAGFGAYIKSESVKKATQEEIDSKTELINEESEKFTNSKDRKDKLSILSNLIVLSDEYSKTEKPQEEVKQKFDDGIIAMKGYFIKDYDAALSKHTLKNIENEEDKEVLISNKEDLAKDFKNIQDEKDIVLVKSSFDAYEGKVKALNEEFDAKIEEIKVTEAAKKAEEERIAKEKVEKERLANEEKDRKLAEAAAEKKAEEERIAKEKTNQVASANKNQPNEGKVSETSSNNSNSQQKPSGGKTLVNTTWSVNRETGEKIPGTEIYHYNDGTTCDSSGDCFNKGDWLETHN